MPVGADGVEGPPHRAGPQRAWLDDDDDGAFGFFTNLPPAMPDARIAEPQLADSANKDAGVQGAADGGKGSLVLLALRHCPPAPNHWQRSLRSRRSRRLQGLPLPRPARRWGRREFHPGRRGQDRSTAQPGRRACDFAVDAERSRRAARTTG